MDHAPRPSLRKEPILLAAILLLALLHGLLYVFLVPPWQHYDEPNHFEYAWLLAHRGQRPQPGDYDRAMRQAVAESMLAHDFFRGMEYRPDLAAEKPWIGSHEQLEELPLYYLLASLPLRALPEASIAGQLHAARLVSLLLYLVSIAAGFGLVAQFTRPGHPLRGLVPLGMALLPAYTDLMTAVNSDVAAIASFSLFLWLAARLVQRGFAWGEFLGVLLATALCLLSKRTVYVALPLLALALLFTCLRGRLRPLAWGLLSVAVLGGILAGFDWGDAALWYRATPQNSPTRAGSDQASEGAAAFELAIQPGGDPVKLIQILPVELAETLSGQPLTLGGWLWASQPLEAQSPALHIFDGGQHFVQPIAIDATPRFFAFPITPQGNTWRAWLAFEPLPGGADQPVQVFADGLVLAVGEYPADQPPVFEPGAARGSWGGRPFENLLRNPSAEAAWFYLRPWADQASARLFSDYGQDRPSLALYTLLDPPAAGWFYQRSAASLFRTFWAKFGWGHVPLIGHKPYARALLPFTLLALAGWLPLLWQNRRGLRRAPWAALMVLAAALAGVWGMALVRASNYIFIWTGFLPVARYAFPVIAPTMLALAAGWLAWLELLEKGLRLPGWVKGALFAACFLALDAAALWSLWRYYGAG